MAVDTAAKRASALGFSLTTVNVIPDSTIDQGDMQTILSAYSGILATAPPVSAFVRTGLQVKDYRIVRHGRYR